MNRRNRFRTAFVAAALVAGAVGAAAPASAHDTCGGDANGPYISGSNVEGRASYICQSQHDRSTVTGCLQKKVSGTWTDKDCNTNDTGAGANQSTVSTRPDFSCSTGEWRTVFKYGAAYNNLGQLAHEQAANEISPVTTVNSC